MTDRFEPDDGNAPEPPQCCAPGRAAFASILRRGASGTGPPASIVLTGEEGTSVVPQEKCTPGE